MIESLRLIPWSTPLAANPDPLMLSDRVDGDRRLVSGAVYGDSPADWVRSKDALGNSAWWRAMNVIASLVARTPFHIKEVDDSPEGVKKTPDKDHDAYFATTHQANPEETAMQCRFRIAWNAAHYGVGYAGIWHDAPGGTRLYPFETYEIRKFREDGVLWYERDTNPWAKDEYPGRFKKFRSDEMIEVSGYLPDGMAPPPTWWLARNALADGIEAAKMRAARSRNNGRPALALTTPAVLNEKAATRVQEDFMRVHAGYDGYGKPAILDNGMTVTALPYAPEFAAEEALSKISLREISNWTGVPSVMIGDTAGLAYESLEKLLEMFFRFCGEHYWSSYEDQVRAKLLTEKQRRKETHTAEFNRQAMQFMSAADTAQMIRAWGAGTPVMTPNNIRAKIGEPPLPDPEANKLQMPKNIGKDGSASVPDGDSNDAGRPSAKAETTFINEKKAKEGVSADTPCQNVSKEPSVERAMSQAWEDTSRRVLKAAERKASHGKAFMEFCDSLDKDAEVVALAFERSRAVGSNFGVEIDEARAVRGLTAIKDRLLELAGAATTGKALHEAFHREHSKLMVILPDVAAKAVLA